jgi:hypothetical protein
VTYLALIMIFQGPVDMTCCWEPGKCEKFSYQYALQARFQLPLDGLETCNVKKGRHLSTTFELVEAATNHHEDYYSNSQCGGSEDPRL